MTLTTEQTLARSMSEEELLRVVLDLMELHGWWAYHVRNSKAGIVQGRVGFPDLIAIGPVKDSTVPVPGSSRLIVAELKSDRGRLTDAQSEWLRRFSLAGAEAYCWRPSHYLSGRIGTVLALHVLGEP